MTPEAADQLQRIEDKLDQLLVSMTPPTSDELKVAEPLLTEAGFVAVNPDTGEILAPTPTGTYAPCPECGGTDPGCTHCDASGRVGPLFRPVPIATTPTGRRKRVTLVTPEFRSVMVSEFMDRLGGTAEVERHIDSGIAHKSHAKYDGKQQHIRNWLKKAVEYRKQARGSPEGLEAKRTAQDERYGSDFERRKAEDA